MACRLFRELKLDLMINPMADGAISKIIKRDMGSILQQQSDHAFALHAIDEGDEGDVDIGVSGDNIYSGEEIELEERGSRTRD